MLHQTMRLVLNQETTTYINSFFIQIIENKTHKTPMIGKLSLLYKKLYKIEYKEGNYYKDKILPYVLFTTSSTLPPVLYSLNSSPSPPHTFNIDFLFPNKKTMDPLQDLFIIFNHLAQASFVSNHHRPPFSKTPTSTPNYFLFLDAFNIPIHVTTIPPMTPPGEKKKKRKLDM